MLTQFLSIPLIMCVILLVVPTLSLLLVEFNERPISDCRAPISCSLLIVNYTSENRILQFLLRNESWLSLFETIEHLLKWKIKIKLEKEWWWKIWFDSIWKKEKMKLIIWKQEFGEGGERWNGCRSYSVSSIEFLLV